MPPRMKSPTVVPYLHDDCVYIVLFATSPVRPCTLATMSSPKEPEFTQEQRAYIEDLRATLRGEFERSEESQIHKTTIAEVEDLKQDALEALRHTLKHGDNEAIKTKVAMWTVSTILDAQKAGDSPLADFLKGLPTPTAVEN